MGVTVTESVSVSLSDLSISVSDSVSVAESVGRILVSFVSAASPVSVGDAAAAAISDPQVAIYESVSVSESVEAKLSDLGFTVADSISVADDSSIEVGAAPDLDISKSESISITDSPSIVLSDLAIAESESISITDVASVTITAPSGYEIDVSDSISIADSPVVSLSDLAITKSDSVSVSDSADAFISVGYTIDVSDLVSITDSPSVNPLTVNIHDDYAIESDTELMYHFDSEYESGGDDYSPDASGNGRDCELGNLSLTYTDGKFGFCLNNSNTTAHSDHPSLTFGTDAFTIDFWYKLTGLPGTGLTDYLYIDEDASVFIQIELRNSAGSYSIRGISTGISIAKSGTPELDRWYHLALMRGYQGDTDVWALFIDGTLVGTDTTSVVDFGSFTGQIATGLNGKIDAFRITIGRAIWTGNFTVPGRAGIDVVRITESVSVAFSSDISVSDSISIGEGTNAFIDCNIALADSISVGELITSVTTGQEISVLDSISLSEAVALNIRTGLDVSVSDTISISDAVSAVTSLADINVSDSVSVGESTSQWYFLSAYAYITAKVPAIDISGNIPSVKFSAKSADSKFDA